MTRIRTHTNDLCSKRVQSACAVACFGRDGMLLGMSVRRHHVLDYIAL